MSDVSYNEAQRRELLAFVQEAAKVPFDPWYRKGEDVCTAPNKEAGKVLMLLRRAKRLAAKYEGLPF